MVAVVEEEVVEMEGALRDVTSRGLQLPPASSKETVPNYRVMYSTALTTGKQIGT